MGYKKDEIEAYKTIVCSYYVIDIDIDPQYKDILDNINTCITDYIDKPNNIIEIKNTNSLTLLLKHLNSKIINKLIIRDGQYNNYTNIDLYNILWDIYTNICFKFLIKPTIQRYSIFTGINKSTFNRWTELSNPNDKRRVSVKKWLNECESVLYDDAINTGNVGCLFALKCNYGYKESVIVETNNNVSEKTVEEIAMDYTNQMTENNNNDIDF